MIKKTIIILNEIVLTIFFLLLLTVLVFKKTIGDKKYLLSTLEKNNYYEEIYHHSKSTIEGYTFQLGLTEDDLSNLYSKEKVKNDIDTLINGIYDNKEIKINTEEINQKINDIIINRLKENNRTPSLTEQQAIKQLQDNVSEVYQNEIAYSLKYILKLKQIYQKINFWINKVIGLLIIINLILIIILYFLNKKSKTFIKSISKSILATGIIFILIKILLINKFQHLVILNSILSKLIIFIINDIFKTVFTIGIVLSLISIIGIIIGERKHCK